MPNIIVKFFGPARDLAGIDQQTVAVDPGETVGTLAGRLAKENPRLGALMGTRLAVNRTYVPVNHVLVDGDEVAVIPPVSGGAPMPRAALVKDPIDMATLSAEVQRPDAGAIVTFAGTVRAELSGCKPLLALEYHAYEQMALEQMVAVRDRALKSQAALDAIVVHRLGHLKIGEISIAVAVSAAHRPAAFDACRLIVDLVKADVPIWKKNIWADGQGDWAEPK